MAKDKKKLIQEFKAFISRGNILDMAVGVVIGGAFNAIVTALVNILLSVCTWGVPGGIKGLVTVLPAINDTQKGLDGIGQKFDASQLQELAKNIASQNYAEQIANDKDYLINNPQLIESSKTFITSKYTLHGTTYTYNLSAVIDWGSFINAVISFFIVAITLFVIIKVAKKSAQKREEFKKKLMEKMATNENSENAEENAEEAK